MKALFFISLFIGLSKLNAQIQFINSGKIVFEKKLNLDKEKDENQWLSAVRDKIPKFHTTQHFLYFNDGTTLYEKGGDIEEKNAYLNNDYNANDIIFSNLKKGLFSKKQAIYEESVLLSDSIRKVSWEMTNETRIIAGFECHKATAIILDSIFVIAYYSDQITVSGGPLSFCDLPGMILGVVVPRMNFTIFATSLELTPPPEEKMASPVLRQKLDYNGVIKHIGETTRKFYEKERKRYLINSLL